MQSFRLRTGKEAKAYRLRSADTGLIRCRVQHKAQGERDVSVEMVDRWQTSRVELHKMCKPVALAAAMLRRHGVRVERKLNA